MEIKKLYLYIVIVVFFIINIVLISTNVSKNKRLAILEELTSLSVNLANDIHDDYKINISENKIINDQKPIKYGATIYQVGGIGSTIVDLSAYDLSDKTASVYLIPAKNWVIHSFNSTRERMYANCLDNYKTIECAVDDVKINFIDNDCSLGIKNKVRNKLSIICEKL